MRGIILYQSKYGATEKYARWISDKMSFDIIETKKAKISEIQDYDVIILGGGVYASGIAGLSFLRKNINVLCDRKIIVFCVGASPYEQEAFQAIVQHNMTAKLKDIPVFYCRGAWDMDSMSAMDRNLCKMLRKSVAKKSPDDYQVWEKALMAAGDEKCDWTDRKYIAPIIEEINR
ncbi:MAG: flavodoxin domain-containing protein [Oscillospiraceae bacterium]|nr:flavodoxin domain-containing protein [Oscillospiraceae bacterium]